ncbi:hypothetical protein F5B21DRAFT_528256 [Xylaria acuta]|nr:hypothetical protein F5B21DRAFT_528256 [Xylaria acuta]
MFGALEIVCLSLSIFPLVISLLEHYEDGYHSLSDWVLFRREFVHLVNSLSREQIIFRQHIEGMLRSITDSEYDLKEMMDDMDSSGWSNAVLISRLKSKLSGEGEYENYNTSIETIHNCLKSMKTRLDRCGPPTDITTGSTLRRLQLQRRFRKLQFALRKDKQIDRVDKLFGEAEALAPARQSKTLITAQIFSETKEQASSLHKAISMGWRQCDCESPHAFKLIMKHRSHKTLSQIPASRVLKISFPRSARSRAKSKASVDEHNTCHNSPPSRTGSSQSTTSTKSGGQTVWCQYTDNTLIESVASSTVPDQVQDKPILIKDLCHALQTYGTVGCLGYLHDGQGAHHIFNPNPTFSFTSVEVEHPIHARSTHDRRGADAMIPDLTRAQRMSIALTLAYAMLELYPTPWLPRNIGKADVYFFVRKSGQVIPESPFLLCDVSSSKNPTATHTPTLSHDHSDALLALGIIIMELWFGQSIESLPFWEDHCDEKGIAKPFTSFTAAIEWQKKAVGEAGIVLHDVTYRCIRGNVGPTTIDFNDSNCVRAVFDQVVKPLEGLLAHFWSG